MSAVRPEYGPSLPALLSRPLERSERRIRLALLLVAVAVVVVLLAVSLLRSSTPLEPVLVRGQLPFTLAHTAALDRVAPREGEVLRLQTPAGAATQMTYAARVIDLGAYRGDPTAPLALRATRDAEQLARTQPGYRYRGEGKARIGESPGYVLTTDTEVAGRPGYAKRYYLLPPVEPGDPAPRQAVQLDLAATRGSVFPSPAAIGKNGALKAPLASFRFGTERP